MSCYARSRSGWLGVALATTVLSIPVFAQQVDRSRDGQRTGILETVVVTGSNIRTDVSERDALPLTIISPDDIALQGPQELVRVLRVNPAFSGGTLNGGNGGYFSSPRSTLNLFGIGDSNTLVLVNGRRFNAVTPTNINSIPATAVSSIEILKDGGSSIYGSDAVAGVVNFILDKDFEGMEMSSSYGDRVFGAASGTHARDFTAGIKFGVSGERARFVGNLEFRERGETKATDIELGRTANLHRGVIYSSPGNAILPNGQRVILDYHRFGPGEYSVDPADYIPYDFIDYNSTIGQEQRKTFTDRQPQQHISGFGYSEYDLTDNATLFGEIFYSAFNSEALWKIFGVDFFGDTHLRFGPVPASNPWNPFGVDLNSVFYGLHEIGGVTFDGDANTARLVGGVKGDFGGEFAYDVGVAFFQDDEIRQQQNFYSDAALYAAIRRPGPDALNPFCYACNTPAQLAGIAVSSALQTITEQSIFDAKLSGPLLQRDNYDIAFAAGAETREEKYTFKVDPLTATGDIYVQQFFPDFQARRSSAVFGELAYHLDQGAQIPAVHKLSVNLSARHERIENVGSTTNPHLAVSWQPISDAFRLRASYGTSFKPPPINLLRPETRVVNGFATFPQFNNAALPIFIIMGGNADLEPETAKTLNLGLIIAPSQLPGSSLSVDYFRVRQKNVVLVPNAQDIINGTFPGTVDFSGPQPTVSAIAQNVGGRHVQGIDATLNLQYATKSAGTFGIGFSGVLLTQFDVDNGAGFVSRLGEFQNYLFNTTRSGALGSLPRLRGQGRLAWTSSSGDLDAQLTANYISQYKDGTNLGINRMVSRFLTYDFNLNADLSHFASGLTANVGIINLFDKEPPLIEGYGTTYFYYDPAFSNSFGRLGFFGLKYKL